LCGTNACVDFSNPPTWSPVPNPTNVPVPNPTNVPVPFPTREPTARPLTPVPTITMKPTRAHHGGGDDDDEDVDIGGDLKMSGGALAGLLIFFLGGMSISFAVGFFMGKKNHSKTLKAENVTIDSSSTPSPLQRDLDVGNADRSSFVKLQVPRVSVEGVNPIRFSQKKPDVELNDAPPK